MTKLYPFKFKPLLKEKIWGGEKIQDFLSMSYRTETSNSVGEAWLVYEKLQISNGPWSGKRLYEIISEYPVPLLGHYVSSQTRDVFPLLFKFIDAKDILSIQVHPDDVYARRVENEPFGKCEMWYVVSADPGAKLVHGLNKTITADQLRTEISKGTLTNSVEYIDVEPGDVILNMPGTIHAIGKGIFIYEVQQSSDLTYRVYDWQRKQSDGNLRELHIDKALDVISRKPMQKHKVHAIRVNHNEAFSRTILCACEYFAVEKYDIRSQTMEALNNESFRVITALDGAGILETKNDLQTQVEILPGETILIPANINEYTIKPTKGNLTLLKSYVPNLEHDIVNPLKAIGTPEELILQLGGNPEDSHVARHL